VCGFGRAQLSSLREMALAAHAVGARSKLRLDALGLQWIPRCTARCPSLWKPTSLGSAVEGVSPEQRQNGRRTSGLSQPKGAEGHAELVETRVAPQLTVAREAVAVKSRSIPE
jgi:hypothetical protein